MSSSVQRDNSLDLMKVIAIASVVAIHSGVIFKEFVNNVSPLLAAIGVPVFMVISAYLRTNKIQKTGVKGAYGGRYMFVSFMSLALAYVFLVIAETIICIPIQAKLHKLPLGATFLDSPKDYILWLVTGTVGFGSYYIVLMVQLIVVFPLVYMLFIKNRTLGLILCAVINLCYDLGAHYLGMPDKMYRLLIFRLLLIIGFGIYLALLKEYDKKSDITAAVFLAAGIVYIIINAYFYQFRIFGEWSTSSMLVGPFAYGYVYFFRKKFANIKDHKILEFGRASYHIFIVQMFYFFLMVAFPVIAVILKKLPMPVAIVIMVLISLLITFFGGRRFYRFETKLRKKLNISH